MRTLQKNGSGFTLIELLIVVAIIAILAAIAIPNFLEAQTRSKVSRVKADLRALATAMEAYFADWNSYTYRNGRHENGETMPGWGWGGFRPLTTPVAYTTSLPRDPFGYGWKRSQGLPDSGGGRQAPAYELGCGVAGVSHAGWMNDTGVSLKKEGFPSNTYEMESDGPDATDDTVFYPGNLDFSTGGISVALGKQRDQ